MLKTPSILLLICLLTLYIHHSCARRRNLTEITYRFTNCKSTNHDGPRVINRCGPLYEEMDSPIAREETLFRFEDGAYDGAQGFRLPRDDLYNITVAGASGGEGLCNYHYGLGGVINAQVRLTTDYEYLILVGHKGTSVCDVPENANHPVCLLSRPTNLTEVQTCNVAWYNWTMINASGAAQDNRYSFNGGGGGGGASMIWPRTRNGKQFTNLPIVISPGGGGASAILDYEFFAGRINIYLPNQYVLNYPTSASNERIYSFHTNGHINQYASGWLVGGRGYRPDSRFLTSGAGSGWNPSVNLPLLDIDGKLLSQPTNFAEGGFDCSLALQDPIVDGFVFTNIFGGYGGGGGGCGSGGGGGGYTGGHVGGNVNRIPGGGGDAGVFNLTEFPLAPNEFYHNDGDGYVEIVASNCGCDGECVVYTEERQFECKCPNDTLLAGNGYSCYQDINITVIQVAPLSFTDRGETFFVNGLRFTDSSFLIFGLNVSLTVSPEPGSGLSPEDVACAVVFVDEDSQIALASNPVRASTGMSSANQVVIIGETDDGLGLISDPVNFLDYPVLVTGAFLLTNGECSLASPLQVSISSEDDANLTRDFDTMLLFGDEGVANTSRLILREEAPPTTMTMPPPGVGSSSDVGLIIGLVVVGLVLLLTLMGIAAVLLYIRFTPNKRKSRNLRTVRESQSHLVDIVEGSPTPDMQQSTSFGARYEAINGDGGMVEYATVDKEGARIGGTVEYATVDKKGTRELAISPYATLTGDGKVYENPVIPAGNSFTPRYGIIAPAIDFTIYNRGRTDSTVNEWDYPRNNLVYLRELGEGQFGKVLLMKAKNIAGYSGKIPVAVKTLTSRDPEVVQKFMEEAELMKKFSHPNIVSLLGISVADSDGEVDEDSAPLMILEYMPYGDLESFLTSHKPNENGQTSINQQHFLRFSIDIARALDFLSMNKYVHRDIAARNCLVGPDLHIKIADFGLSRGVYDKDYYKVAGKAVLPVRWMAPESLIFGVFSTASDVWSYGVTIWEITSYGDTPLEDFEVQEIVDAAQNGSLQHTRPVHCSDLLYDVMCQCHQPEAKDRPSFEDILTKLLKENTESEKQTPLT